MRTGGYLHLKYNSVSSYYGRRDGQGQYCNKSSLITGQIQDKKKKSRDSGMERGWGGCDEVPELLKGRVLSKLVGITNVTESLPQLCI